MDEEILEKALKWAQENKPDSSRSHQCAFANSVDYLVNGWVGGYGGPSVRQLAADYALAGEKGGRGFAGDLLVLVPDGSLPPAGNWSLDDAVKFCEPICFGPITELHRMAWEEQGHISFDNDENDIQELEGK